MRGAPGVMDRRLQRRRQLLQQAGVVAQAHERRRRRGAERLRELGRTVRSDPVAAARVVPQQVEQPRHTGEGVEADRVALLAADAGVVGQHDRQAAAGARRRRQPGPAGGSVGRERDAVRVGPMHCPRVFERGVRRRVGLERDGAGQQPAVQLRQDDVHREVGWRQAARGRGPGVAAGAGQHELQHRRAGRVERRGAAVRTGGEGGGVQHHRGPPGPQDSGDVGGRFGRFQAAGINRADGEAALVQRRRERLDRGDVVGQQMRAVEHDGGEVACRVRVPGEGSPDQVRG